MLGFSSGFFTISPALWNGNVAYIRMSLSLTHTIFFFFRCLSISYLLLVLNYKLNSLLTPPFNKIQSFIFSCLEQRHNLPCPSSVSVRFRSKRRGTTVKDHAKNGASKTAGRGWEKRKERKLCFPFPRRRWENRLRDLSKELLLLTTVAPV